jgi:hypothetical protein
MDVDWIIGGLNLDAEARQGPDLGQTGSRSGGAVRSISS